MVLNTINKNVTKSDWEIGIIANSNWEIGIIANSNWEIGIITNCDWEYQKPNFLILGNWVANRDSLGVLPKLGFQLGPIRSDGISLKKAHKKNCQNAKS